MKTIIPNNAFYLLPLALRLQLWNGCNPVVLVEDFCNDDDFFPDYYMAACRYQAAVHSKNSFNKFLDENLRF